MFKYEVTWRNKRYVQAEVGIQALVRDVKKSPRTMHVPLKKELKAYLKTTLETLARRHSSPWPATTKTRLSRRSGRAVKSLKEGARVSGETLAKVRAEVLLEPYLATQEYGAVIRPRRKKYLAIPLRAALNANGVPRKKGPRDWPDTFIFRDKRERLFIARKRGDSLELLYALVKESRIPPRLGLRRELERNLPKFVDRAMNGMRLEIVHALR